jgi:TolB-like protein/DNA-binding winged helix-turn-helix (wHTH) protein/Flp pilus assembly protein TadD
MLIGGSSARVRFGRFECDPATGDLWREGRLVKLQGQPRQILVALLQRPGAVVSREELRDVLWQGGTFVDFDNSLNVGIRKIREALGDDAPTARYLETVRGQGYRFIAPVSPVTPRAGPPSPVVPLPPESAAPPKSATPAAAVTAPAWRSALRPALVTVAGAFAAAVFVAFAVRSAPGESKIGSIAVLPFANLLDSEGQQYLVDGLTQGITSELAARTTLRVISSQSAFALESSGVARSEIASRLDVDALLVGTVARAGAGFVINVHVVGARDDRERWAGRFERSVNELSVPDDIVVAIMNGIGGLASPASHSRNARVVLPEARDAFLRGRFFWAKRGEANAVTAIQYLSTAIQLQPDYAEAWAGLADVYAIDEGAPSPVIVPWPGSAIRAGEMAAQEALRLSPTLGEAHAALGKLYVSQRRWTEAERSLRRAVELAPQYSTARQWYGTMFLRLHRCDEALEQVLIGARLDPLTALINEAVGSTFLLCGEPERAIDVFRSVLRMHPDAHTTRQFLGRALTRAGRHDEAIEVLEDLHAQHPGQSVATTLAVAYVNAGRVDDAQRLIPTILTPFFRATVFAALHEPTRMWEALELALGTNGGALQNLLSESVFAAYYGDPRFLDFASRAGFPVPPTVPARFSRPLPAQSPSSDHLWRSGS